jgi:hypothetical protein
MDLPVGEILGTEVEVEVPWNFVEAPALRLLREIKECKTRLIDILAELAKDDNVSICLTRGGSRSEEAPGRGVCGGICSAGASQAVHQTCRPSAASQ